MNKIAGLLLILIFSFSVFGQAVILNPVDIPRVSLNSLDKNQIFGCSVNAETFTSGSLGTLIPGGTGNKSLDHNIQTDVVELQKVFRVSAKMFLFKESGLPNAFALNVPLPEVLRKFQISPQTSRDGMVFFGLDLMKSEYSSDFGTGFAIPSIISHEYAHVLQYKLRFPFSGKWQELHADYMAGWYTAHRARFVSQNIIESMLSFYKRGDYDFNNMNHHGTPQERQQAFAAGVNLNLRNNVRMGRVAYEQGIQYLRLIGAN